MIPASHPLAAAPGVNGKCPEAFWSSSEPKILLRFEWASPEKLPLAHPLGEGPACQPMGDACLAWLLNPEETPHRSEAAEGPGSSCSSVSTKYSVALHLWPVPNHPPPHLLLLLLCQWGNPRPELANQLPE